VANTVYVVTRTDRSTLLGFKVDADAAIRVFASKDPVTLSGLRLTGTPVVFYPRVMAEVKRNNSKLLVLTSKMIWYDIFAESSAPAIRKMSEGLSL